MTLTINPALDLITVSSSLLDGFIASPISYTSLTVTIYHNSTETSVSEVYTDTDPITAITNVQTNAGVETIVPECLNMDTFTQGVYHVVISLKSSTQIQTEEGCLYVENGLKCLVDDYMLDETKSMEDRVLTGLKYNILLDVANCDCKCDKYIDLYNNLVILTGSEKCKTC